MDKKIISDFLLKNTYLVNVFQGDDLVSQGSAFPINKYGDLLTAAHVISGKLPYADKDIQGLTILSKRPGEKYDNYCCSVFAPRISLPYFKDPIFIDAAILINTSREKNVEYFETSEQEIVAGTDILMCGYSDEITLPMLVQDNFDLKHPDLKGMESSFLRAIETHMPLNVVKGGMIGKASKIDFKDSNISGYTLYIDNEIHSGASGGPVVDEQNLVIGIITQRAITDISTSEHPRLKIPSGSTIAISPSLILQYLPNT